MKTHELRDWGNIAYNALSILVAHPDRTSFSGLLPERRSSGEDSRREGFAALAELANKGNS
jgi:hypothetical protein